MALERCKKCSLNISCLNQAVPVGVDNPSIYLVGYVPNEFENTYGALSDTNKRDFINTLLEINRDYYFRYLVRCHPIDPLL